MKEISLQQLLGLSTQEQRLYRVLSTEPLTVATAARLAGLPRTTVHHILQRLLKRNLIARVKRQHHYFYKRVREEQLLQSLLASTSVDNIHIPVPISADISITVYYGHQGIYDLYKKVCEENSHKRVYTIQTTTSTRKIFHDYTIQSLDILHELMIKNQLIMEDIIEEDFFEPVALKFGSEFQTKLQTFLNRMTVVYVLPTNYISFSVDMVLFKDVVAFIDWQQQVAVEIRHMEVVRLCFDLFGLLKNHARHVRFHELARKYMA